MLADGLYTCIMFRKSLDDFKANAREKRFTLREFTYDPNALAAEEAKKSADTAESDKLKKMLENWCHINYAECFTMMMHLKAVRTTTLTLTLTLTRTLTPSP
jgi:V-type H+-transporting ATPase subunit C